MGSKLIQCVSVMVMAMVTVLSCCLNGVQSSQVPAMFVFGDSIVDNGNNNYLASYAKSNYLPYGIDFYQGPTGRFSNGRTVIDLLGEMLGLPYLTAYEAANTVEKMLHGVNFASATGGILDRTGQFLVSKSVKKDAVVLGGTKDK